LRNSLVSIVLAGSMVSLSALGCGASSAEEQRRALTYQQKSDDAAKEGEYGRAGDAQRKAQDAHYTAVRKAIDEGNPIPPQPRIGDTPPPLPSNTPERPNP
jgi:hypothetical protein